MSEFHWIYQNGQLSNDDNCSWIVQFRNHLTELITDMRTYVAKKMNRIAELWWTAPEFLRVAKPNSRGSQKGDVYSIGIIIYEIAYRRSPYSTDVHSPKGRWNVLHIIEDSAWWMLLLLWWNLSLSKHSRREMPRTRTDHRGTVSYVWPFAHPAFSGRSPSQQKPTGLLQIGDSAWWMLLL